jgi:ribonuclease HII
MPFRKVIGVDEVGRGCLAGPVVCGAVILPDEPPAWVDQIKDSKKLTPKKRQELAEYITKECVYAIREGPVHQIDDINILQATLRTMRKCVVSICAQTTNDPDAYVVLVDGNQLIPELGLSQEAITGGDSIHKTIGAASIIAKVYRDNYMIGQAHHYPEYGFARHKGYGTEEHRKAIMIHGPCKIHRKTFKGVYEYV